ncbi:MAG: hypothetical protein ACPGC9_01185, partial [Cytophagales bacterium]
ELYFRCWTIVNLNKPFGQENVQTLTPAQKKLSPYGIISAFWLRKKLEEGFSLESWDPIKTSNLKVSKTWPPQPSKDPSPETIA